jgi:hypothetical protein
MLPLLNQYEPGMTGVECINEATFGRRLDEIRHAYLDLAMLRDEFEPKARIFTHAYDFAPVTGKGFLWIDAWMKPNMELKGIKLQEVQQEIIDFMLRKFKDMQIELAGSHPPWTFVDTQGTLAKEEWANELHPTHVGFQRIARKFEEALASAFPQLPKP